MLLLLLGKAVPTWVSPADGATISPDTPLVFKSLPRTAPSHFNLQVATASDFTTAIEYRSDRGGFEYYDGAAWIAIPSAGMPSVSSGNNVRYTTNLPTGTLYARVRQSK